MLSVLRVHLPSDIPIVGCELSPYVLVRRPDQTVFTDDVPESSPIEGHFLRYKWYRIQSDKKVAICSVHPSEQATLQCLGCVKAKIPVAKSYHCSPKCFSDAWQHHRVLHERAASAVNENGNEEEEIFGRFNNNATSNASLSSSQSLPSLANGATPLYPAAATQRSGGETWFEVGRSKTYTPTADDIGHVLKFECVVVDAETKSPIGHGSTILTSRVIPAPSPSPRRLISVSNVDVAGHLDVDGRSSSTGTFTVLSYNILSDSYATSELYGYCPSWALSWPYRRQNLLREIVGYRADIVCLQEVQSDHFEEFFAPELDKHGYQALYKKKTAEVFNGSIMTIDGCATFFRRDRFSHVKKYEVEFNKAAQSLTDALVPSAQKKTALNRLVKANTHVNVQQDLKDVKLWQVHTLLKGLEKIAASADIPMLVCGDFNSVPGSAPHALLAIGKVDPMHPDLAVDPLGILRPATKLTHSLPLVSAYSSFARIGVGLGYEQQKRRVDPATNEPLFTNCTRDFIGTLDYIFYSADSLTVESLLELLDEDSLRKDTALPSPEWSSDHIALLAEFRCKPRTRR
ncbi:carbon catabolite repressor protein 4 homolog 1-like isoform X2 [Cynara cardunculus var. scolymus]|uniref:carbon catabolite repressor protein 4 homolog 1-like isoform X2 n=1 Tax=Cynara cardunculus var. scolymus TaxID=59895 RepID=UPI000D63092E|nr:carbon catabolite repressor protein 4 homolog 1-like isoform X2 [Cynara cardunculus var. scolymus]